MIKTASLDGFTYKEIRHDRMLIILYNRHYRKLIICITDIAKAQLFKLACRLTDYTIIIKIICNAYKAISLCQHVPDYYSNR